MRWRETSLGKLRNIRKKQQAFRDRRRQVVAARLALVLIVLAGTLSSVHTSASANTSATLWQQVVAESETNTHQSSVRTRPDGSVNVSGIPVGSNAEGGGIQMYDAAGGPLGSLDLESYARVSAPPTIDGRSNTYFWHEQTVDNTSTSYITSLNPGGGLRWQTSAPSEELINESMVVGGDGKLWFLTESRSLLRHVDADTGAVIDELRTSDLGVSNPYQVFPYEEGVVVFGYSTATPDFRVAWVTPGGRSALVSVPVDGATGVYIDVHADGRVVFATKPLCFGSDNRSAGAGAIDPTGLVWQHQFSPVAHYCSVPGPIVKALPGGGALIGFTLEGSTGGFTRFSNQGNVLWDREWETSGYLFVGRAPLIADTDGNIIAATTSPEDDCEGPGSCFGFSVARIDSSTGDVLEELVAKSGADQSWLPLSLSSDEGRLYLSYRYSNGSDASPASLPGTEFVEALSVPALGDDYSDTLIHDEASPPPPAGVKLKYVALGDSFSAGEGLEPFFESENRCHRSELGYSTFIEPPGLPGTSIYDLNRSGVPGIEWGFQACSGATTENVLYRGRWGDPLSQLAQDRSQDTQNANDLPVDATTDLVTITIGGNDIRFSEVLRFCAFSNNCTTERYNGRSLEQDARRKRDELSPRLDRVIARIHTQAPLAKIVVAGYPQLFPATAAEQNCPKLAQRDYPRRVRFGYRFQSFGFSQPEQNYLRQATAELNQLIAARVEASGFATFVPVDNIFAGHEVCGSAGEWVNGPSISGRTLTLNHQSFHPNADGQHLGYAEAINRAIGLDVPGF